MDIKEYISNVSEIKGKSLSAVAEKLSLISVPNEIFGIAFQALKDSDGCFSFKVRPYSGKNWSELNPQIDYFFVETKTDDVCLIHNFYRDFKISLNYKDQWITLILSDNERRKVKSFSDGKPINEKEFLFKEKDKILNLNSSSGWFNC